MTNLVNDKRFDDARGEFREFGRTHANGGAAFARAFGRAVELAQEGVINSTKVKGQQDHAEQLYDELAKAHHSRAVTGASLKSQVSKFRLAVKVGEMTTLGQGGPKAQVDRVVQAHKAQEELEEGSTTPLYTALQKWARQQIDNSDNPLSDEELTEIVRKEPTATKDAAAILTEMRKKLDNLITGKNGVKCQDEHVIEARTQIDQFLATLQVAERTQKLRAEAEELGIALAA